MSSVPGANCPLPRTQPRKKPPAKPRKKPKKKAPPRRQYKRRDWEDGGGIGDDGRPNPEPEPVLGEPPPTRLAPGPQKVEVLRRRHEAKTRLWGTGERTIPVDMVAELVKLGQFMRWAVLQARGRTKYAHAVLYQERGRTPGHRPCYRVEVSRPPEPGRRSREHIANAATEGEAKAILIDWCAAQGITDVEVEPPEWLRECLRDALIAQGQYGD